MEIHEFTLTVHGPHPLVKEFVETSDKLKNDDMRQGAWELFAFIKENIPGVNELLIGEEK